MLEDIISKSPSFVRIVKEVKFKRLNHAIMLISQDKIYLEEFAKSLLSLLFCENLKDEKPCGVCNSCDNAKKLLHPDILVYGKDKLIDIDDAGEIVSTALVRPYSADKKVYLLYNFDEINKTVENKLLKTIEEPPQDVLFILLVSNTNKLLQTTLSRTQKIFLETIPQKDLVEILKDKGIENAELIASGSCGNLEKSLGLAGRSKIKEIYSFIFDMLINMNSTYKILQYSTEANNYTDCFDDFINAMQMILLDCEKAKAGENKTISNVGFLKYIQQIANEYSFTALTKIVEQTYIAKQMLDANVTKVNIIDQLLLKIVEVRIKCKR